MELNLQPASSVCAVSGEPFAEGTRVVSFLVRRTTLEVLRYDLMATQAEGFAPEGTVVCRWVHGFKPRSREGDAGRALRLTAENLFLTLADPTTEPTPENNRLLQFLALMLERKKILRPRGRTPDGARALFEHAKTKQMFELPAEDLTPQFFVAIQEQLSILVGEPAPKAEKPAEPQPAA